MAKLIIEDARRYLEAEMGLTNLQWSAIEEAKSSSDIHELSLRVENVQLNTSPPAPVPSVESEDIFATVETKKRRSAEIETPHKDKPPGALRKSPRLQQLQEISDNVVETPVRKKSSPLKNSNNDSVQEIADSPVIVLKKQRRSQRTTKAKQTKSARCQNVENNEPKQTANPMQNQLIDVNDFDSIGFSDAVSQSPSLHDSHILSVAKDLDTPVASLAQLRVVNVCGNCGLFERFCTELQSTNTVGLSVAVGSHISENPHTLIGGNLLMNQIAGSLGSSRKKNCTFNGGLLYVAGVSICLAETEPAVAFYLNFQDDDTAAVPFRRKVALLNEFLARIDVTIQMYDVREQCKVLAALPEVGRISAHLEDPRIANWLLQPDVDASLVEMVHYDIFTHRQKKNPIKWK